MRRAARGRMALALVVGATLGLVGCGSGGPPNPSGVMTIVASPSLTEAITWTVHAFTTTHPSLRVQTEFEPDSRIPDRAAQSPAPDVIAAEDPATLTAAGVTTEPVHFARGQLVLAVPNGNPALLTGLADLVRPDVRVALCEPVQPCGEIAVEVLAAAAVTVGEGAILEPDVRSALRHVTEGTADAALVYRSDAAAAGEEVMTIEIPQSSAALADFVATVPASAPNAAVAEEFLDYLMSTPVRDTLTSNGFRPAT